MIFVEDLQMNFSDYGLSKRFVDILPTFCEDCGAPLSINETLTGLHCSNPRCKSKVVMRIKAICQSVGILFFGESRIEKYVDYYHVTNPLDIFKLQRGMVLSDEISEAVSDSIIEQIEEKKSFVLWEFVSVANLPFIQTSAQLIFQGYSTLEDAYRDIEKGGIPFIQKKMGISANGEVSIQAIKVYKSLMEYKSDLLEGVQYVNIINLGDVKELNVVCSDEVGNGFKKKAEFYSYINNTFGDKVHVNFLPSVKKSIDYLVWAGADGSPARYTSKVKTVEGYNAKGCNIPILTAAQFIEEMEKL